MLSTTLSSKGQIILPSKLRKKINIKKGSKFIIEFRDNKIILTLLNKEYYEKLAGSISENGKLLKSLISEKEKEKNL
ncbi:AbrB/MazE/SpoVT family DNA-binding domain-containing protein [bacterium]|nr:AbrB/MazE/SpoVT family DNA-binding domain-containing protein [bacterium]